MNRCLFLAGLLLFVGACAEPDRGEPGSSRRIAFDTLDRIDVHCVGHRRIRCHNHLDGKPPAGLWRSSSRWRR